MKTKLQKLAVYLSIIVLAVMLGCASFQDAVTPCYIPPASLAYADANATTFLPFTTLFDAKRVGFKMDFVYAIKQTTNRMEYEFLKGLNMFHVSAAEELQTTLFSPEGPLGLLLPTIFGGTLGALLIKRPGDINGNKKKTKETK